MLTYFSFDAVNDAMLQSKSETGACALNKKLIVFNFK